MQLYYFELRVLLYRVLYRYVELARSTSSTRVSRDGLKHSVRTSLRHGCGIERLTLHVLGVGGTDEATGSGS